MSQPYAPYRRQVLVRRAAWLFPAIAALLYPLTLAGLHRSGLYFVKATLAGDRAVAIALMAITAMLVYSVPIIAFLAIERARDLRAKRIAHLAFAAPPLFVVIGVFFYMLNMPQADYVTWAILWIAVLAAATSSSQAREISPPTPWLAAAHGFSAVAIIAMFLTWHLLNHMTAIWSLDLNKNIMDFLRGWYRSNLVQPMLITLIVFQLLSGIRLLLSKVSSYDGIYASIQTATAAYLLVFITSHVIAVFILGRMFLGVDTTFAWASGAPTGLLLDPWNVRLIPHYSLAVLFLICHLAMGLRTVLLAHRAKVGLANGLAWTVCALGLVLSVVILIAQLGVQS